VSNPRLLSARNLHPQCGARAAPPSAAHQAENKPVSANAVLTGKAVAKEFHSLPRKNSFSLPRARGVTVGPVHCFARYKIPALLFQGVWAALQTWSILFLPECI